ncbi:MAG TPA: signal peptidase I [Candidatus Saccharimonadales bacterium]|nr:signal peptidase I [Candidatus Saccharimonadales bacterium]
MRNYSKILKNTVLGLIIVFSLVIIASTLDIFGHRQFVVASGSMEPKIMTGSMVFDQKSSNYKIGDVITFKKAGSKDTVTHRIVSVKNDASGQTFYTVKGDANSSPDADPVAKSDVVGKVSFSIPYVGYLVNYIKTLPGLVIFIIIPATILIYQELVNIKSEIAGMRRTKRKIVQEAKKAEETILAEERELAAKFTGQPRVKKNFKAPSKVVVMLFVAAAALTMTAGASKAYYSDTADLTGNTVTTAFPANQDACKDGGWQTYADLNFKNQGDCVSWIATHGNNPPSGG